MRKTRPLANLSPHRGHSTNIAASLRRDLPGLFALLAAVVATRAVWFGDPVADYDEQLYSFIGWRLQYGELPYVDWWDRKPFGLFAIFGLAHLLLGPGPIAFQLFAALSAFLAGWLTYANARLIGGRLAATFAGVVTIILLSAYGSHSGQSEIFFTPLLLAMVRLLAERDHPGFTRRAALAMLIGGLALQVKYTVVPHCLAFGLYALWIEHRRGANLATLAKRALLFVFLGLLPTLLIALLYLAAGGFEDFFFANFVSFFDRIPASQGRWQSRYRILVAPLAVLAVGGIYATFRTRSPRDWAVWQLFVLFALASIGSVFLPGTVYGYYFAGLVAPVALLAVPMFDSRAVLRIVFNLLLLAVLVYLLNLPARYDQSQQERREAQRFAQAIAPYVDARRDCLWMFDGHTSLYRMTNSCVPTRFVYPDHLNNALETEALGVNQADEVARILATRPSVIVTADRPVTPQNRKATALVEAALAQKYRALTTNKLRHRTLTAWARKAAK
ncbi:ArnT family glycosyltransferase [Aurantiacibacter suaedae]|uniref:ArnT family glycosyltransferase n=1 Tax=Aurantiacibacter suaedae TaxID=2545755 RepID=UPI0010F9ABC0|nr:glycosyltransferase family 39 protein [Aurantiacibacter suaedae]